MVFENCHHFILIEVRYPVEKSIQIASRILVKSLTGRIYRHVVIDEFDFIEILFPLIYHEAFLVTELIVKYPSNRCIYPESRAR